MTSVRAQTLELLRALRMTTIFGNPGSTELPLLAGLPNDFRYVLALHEGGVVAMADGYAQATGGAALVSLHSASGPGNAMGSIVNAFHNRAPLVMVAGQQDRRHLALEPYLFARSVELVQPYVKWSHEPARAQDVPATIQRAWHVAMHAPAGPTFVSVPMDDWAAPAEPLLPSSIGHTVAPAREALAAIGERLATSARPVVVVGAGVDRAGGWDAAVALAERLHAPVWAAPQSPRAGFPEDHSLFRGHLAPGRAHLAEQLAGHDLAVVAGAPVFAFLPYEPGTPALPSLALLTDDLAEAARAPVDLAAVGDVRVALEEICRGLPAGTAPTTAGPVTAEATAAPRTTAERPVAQPGTAQARAQPIATGPAPHLGPGDAISTAHLVQSLARALPADAVLVEEAPSARPVLRQFLRIRRPGGFYASASGGLGFALPAAIGIKLGQPERTVVCLVGDGSALYVVQALWTAAQHAIPVAFIVAGNQSYAILEAFASFAGLSNVPGVKLPGIDFGRLAAGFGCEASWVDDPAELEETLRAAIACRRPHLLHVVQEAAAPSLFG